MIRSAEGANAVAATAITVWGVATGLSYEVLLAGFAGGLVSLSFLDPMSAWRRVWTPITATLTAGYTSPIAAGMVAPGEGSHEPLQLLITSAFVIGLCTQMLIPYGIKLLRAKLAEYDPEKKA